MSDNCCTVNVSFTPSETPADACCTPNLSSVTVGFSVAAENVCPACGGKGKKIDTITVKAMLARSLRNVNPTEQYFFCKTPDCDTVYFCGEQTFSKNQLRERVHQKEPADAAVPVCCCFGHTPASIRLEIEATGSSSAVDDVNTGIKAGQCACEVRNPQGNCCLGNVRAVVEKIGKTVGAQL